MGSPLSWKGPQSHMKVGTLGSPKYYEIGDGGPQFHVKMGTRGPHFHIMDTGCLSVDWNSMPFRGSVGLQVGASYSILGCRTLGAFSRLIIYV